jgi:hypothetical protein
MERLAWLAWHTLLPWRKQGDKSTPADLLPKAVEAKATKKEITKEEAREELAALVAEFEVE